MKGKRKLDILPAVDSNKTARLRRRNDFILCRYYYYTNLVQPVTTYEHRIHTISEEIYLSSATVSSLLMNSSDVLRELVQAAPTRKDLQSRHPHYNWS